MKLRELYSFGVIGGKAPYASRVLNTQPASLIALWSLDDAVGSATAIDKKSGFNGVVGANVTLGGAGAGSSTKTSAAFTGTTAAINIYSAGFNTAFTPAEFTIAMWGLTTPSAWTDGGARAGVYLRSDINNRVFVGKHTTNNTLQVFYTAGATNKPVNVTSGITGWYHLAVTINKTADQMNVYYNGALQGATQTGLGTWVGALNAAQCVIGGNAVGWWEGSLDEVAIWTKALTPAEIAALAVL